MSCLYTKQTRNFLRRLSCSNFINILSTLTQQTRCRCYASDPTDPFPSQVGHYLYRAKLIDSFRLALRSKSPYSLARLLTDRNLDSFVVTQALRSAPSADTALYFFKTLDALPHFSHTQHTVQALATVLARFRSNAELKSLIDDVNDGRYKGVRFNFMNLMQWHSAALDLDSFLGVWDQYKIAKRSVCIESYNLVMALYAQMGKDIEAVHMFSRIINEGAIPNCRTYTIMMEHLVNSGKVLEAFEVFNVLPYMRIKRTLKQYMILVEGFVGAKRYDEAKTLLKEMRFQGIMPTRAMLSSLQILKEEGLVEETGELLKEMIPDERIQSIEYCDETGDEDGDDECLNQARVGINNDAIHLKKWLDPRALANALKNWNLNEVSVLESANFVWNSRLVCKVLRNFNNPDVAWKFFCWVANQPRFTHDIYTVERIIDLLARSGHTELVDRLVYRIKMEGMRLPFATVRSIIDYYGLLKNSDAALKFFNEGRISVCGPISTFKLMLLYSSLLRALTRCRRDSDALDVLNKMISDGVSPDIQTYTGLIHHFAQKREVETMQKLCGLVKQSGLEPDAFMYKVLIFGYCKCEKTALALRIFEDTKTSGLILDAPTKDLLVRSLWKEGKRKEAAAVLESSEKLKYALPLNWRGHLWTVSSIDLTKVYNTYLNCFTSECTGDFLGDLSK